MNVACMSVSLEQPRNVMFAIKLPYIISMYDSRLREFQPLFIYHETRTVGIYDWLKARICWKVASFLSML